MSIKQVLAILWARRWIAVLTLLASIAAAALVLSLLPRQYDATAQVYVNLADADPITSAQLPAGVTRNYIQTQIETIRSRGVAYKVVENLDLKPASAAGTTDEIASGLLQRLTVTRVGTSDIISITFRARTPQDAARFANAFTDAYIAKDIELRAMPARELFRFYEERLSSLRQRVAELEVRRSEIRAGADIRGDGEGAADQANPLATQITNARVELVQARIALDEARSGRSQPAENSDLAQLRRQVADLDVTIPRETAQLGPDHRRVRQLRDSRAALQEQLDAARRRASAEAVTDAERRVAAAERRYNDLLSAAEADQRSARTQAGARSGLVAVEREVETLKNQIDAMIQRRERLRLEGALEQGAVSRLSEAAPPTRPSTPQVRVVLALAAGLGILFGLALSMLNEMFDRRVRCRDDIDGYLDVPLLAVMPKARTRRLGTLRRRPTARIGSERARPPAAQLASRT